MIRNTEHADTPSILSIVERSGQFDAAGLAHVRGTLEQHLESRGDEIWLTAVDDEPVGVAYCAPEPVTSGTWNLLMLWIHEDHHGKGHGAALVSHVEQDLLRRSARLLIVETSGLPEFATARAFYTKCGFVHEATIKDFFAAGDDKLVFTKAIV